MARRLLRRSLSYSSAEDMVVSSIRLLSARNPNESAPLHIPLHSVESSPRPGAAPPPTTLLPSLSDRLRVVFLHKPPGRAALHRALSSTGLDAALALHPEALSDVVNAGNLSGGATVDLFDWAISTAKLPPSLHTCNAVIRALGRRKFFKSIEDALETMRKNDIFPDPTTLEIVIDSLVASRQINRAVQLLKSDQFGFGIGQTCHRKVAFSALIKCLCQRSHVGVASSLLQAARGDHFHLDKHVYNDVIGGWARFGRVDKLEHFWAMMLEDGLVPDEVSHCHLIEALGRAGQPEEGLRVFEQMVHEGYGPTTMAYNALIFNFISSGDLDRCIKYYKDMLDKNCPPNSATYCKMIRALLRARRVADALQMFGDMLTQGVLPNTGDITLFIEPLCTYGPPHAALMIYRKSRKAGCTISLKAYKLLLARLARFGKSGIVLKIWEEMQESGHPSDKEVYEFIVNGLCNVGKVDAAVSVVEESLTKGICLGRVVYSKLNNRLLEMDKVETAYNLSKKIKVGRTLANSRNYCRANEHLSQGLPYKLSQDDIFLTAGGTQAIEAIIPVLAQPGTNILLPKPGYPNYEARAAFNNLEVRHFNLIPEKGWEIDVDSLESIADKNTTAMVIINPNNPCGSVYSFEHLAKVAEVARKLGILVIADEVYGKLVLGSAPFIPMGVFGHIAPVLTIGSLSKSWIVPGWRLGWIAVCDPKKIATSITNFLNVSTDPATFIQGALPQILENTKEEFFQRIIALLTESSEICYREIKENKFITCPHKPEGSMFVMVKLMLHLLEDIDDDIDFCCKLAKEESVILCPGSVLGMENWVRITFAIVPSSLLDGLQRIKSFCQRHKKKNLINGS